MISNVVWATPSPKRRSTVSEKVDVHIRMLKNVNQVGNKKEYVSIRFFGPKFELIFKDAEHIRFGRFGNYIILQVVDDDRGYTVYRNNTTNPEIRIPVDDILAMNYDPEEMFGSFLIKFDRAADAAYIDLTRKATV